MRRRGARPSTPTTPTRESPPRSGRPSPHSGSPGAGCWSPGAAPGSSSPSPRPRRSSSASSSTPPPRQIARALYPDADIRAESFAHTRLPDAYFDLTVGNVPFADVRLHDPRHNPGAHSLHNHFIVKSLRLTRPGGLVAVLSSHYTLDAANPAARREMSTLADLVGAVRLPTGAHRRAAGTDALMDLLILRRRHPDEPARETSWENTRLVDVDDRQVRINSYLAEHPQLRPRRAGSRTGHVRRRHTARPPARQPRGHARAADRGARRARRHARVSRGWSWGPRDASRSPAAAGDPSQTAQLAPEGVWDGHITASQDGTFTVTSDGLAEPLKVPASHRSELRALLALRDTARSLLATEASTLEDTAEIAELRSQLGGRYRDYQRRYGPINRFTLRRTGRTDPATGEERMARVTPTAVRLLRSDPFAALVQALENFDETTQTATPAGILTGAGRGPARPAARRRHAAGRARDLPGHPRPRRSRRDRPPPRHRPRGGSGAAGGARLRGPGRAAAGARGRVPVRERPRQARPRPPSRDASGRSSR